MVRNPANAVSRRIATGVKAVTSVFSAVTSAVATGTTPLQWLLNQSLGRARVLLESTDLPVERIGELSGLGTANNLRHHFLRQIGVSPSDYRRAFPRVAGQVAGESWADSSTSSSIQRKRAGEKS